MLTLQNRREIGFLIKRYKNNTKVIMHELESTICFGIIISILNPARNPKPSVNH